MKMEVRYGNREEVVSKGALFSSCCIDLLCGWECERWR